MTRWVIDTDPGEDAVRYYGASELCYKTTFSNGRVPTCTNVYIITSDTLNLSFNCLLTLVVF